MNKIRYKIVLKSNFLTAQSGVIGKNIDITYKRNSKGIPVINGKLIKGVIRDKFTQLLNTLGIENNEKIENIFGSEGKNISKLFFYNLYMKTEDKDKIKTSSRHSIKMDRKTKTTVEGSLFDYEFIERGQEFFGEIEIKKNISKEDLKLFLASMFHIDRLGGNKSRGLGNVEILINLKDNEYVGIEKIDEILETIEIEDNTIKNVEYKKYNFELEFLTPLVLQENKITNLITSRNALQGSTIRGALIDLGLRNGMDIDKLRDIEVKLINKNINLKSEFVTKYKLNNGVKKFVDKTLITDEDKLLKNEKGNKFERSNVVDFKTKSDDISIKINYETRTAEDKMLFNHEVIENVDNIYYGQVYLPKDLILENVSDIIYIGKYKSKGFGKVKIKLFEYNENLDLKEKIKNKIIKFNEKINDDKKYITFDFLSDCILPLNKVDNVLNEFKILTNLKSELENEIDRTFVTLEKLKGYNIVNNVRKADELIITKGSVLTYSYNNLDDILENLVNVEEKGIGLRRKEGFGIISVCTETSIRKDIIK